MKLHGILFMLKTPKKKMAEFANSLDPDEVAHNELYCLLSFLRILRQSMF